MKTALRLLPIVFAATPVLAHSYSYGWSHPSQWGAPHNASGDLFTSFETLDLPTGVQVQVSSAIGGYGPTSTLPGFYEAVSDGSNYSPGRYDGNRAFLNTSTNKVADTFNPDKVGDLTFFFAQPVVHVGFSLGHFAPGGRLKINGVDQGAFLPLFNDTLLIESNRQGYFEIFGQGITSVTLDVIDGDAIVLDHLLATPTAPVPEPATFATLVLGCSALLRKRKAKQTP